MKVYMTFGKQKAASPTYISEGSLLQSILITDNPNIHLLLSCCTPGVEETFV